MCVWGAGGGVSIIVSHWLAMCLSMSYIHIFFFPDDNLSRYQWIFTKLHVCIDTVEICFGIANGQILTILTLICPQHFLFFISR